MSLLSFGLSIMEWSCVFLVDQVVKAVQTCGVDRVYCIGCKVLCPHVVDSVTGQHANNNDKLLAVINELKKVFGEEEAAERLLDACGSITSPIIGAVRDELHRLRKWVLLLLNSCSVVVLPHSRRKSATVVS